MKNKSLVKELKPEVPEVVKVLEIMEGRFHRTA